MTLPDYLQVCRLCVLKHKSFANIFEINGMLEIRVADVINELLELNVYPGDGLPEKICCDCLNELARFKRFKSISFEAKTTLECVIKNKGNTWPKPLSTPSISGETNTVEIVDLVENDEYEDEDSCAETIAAPSPISHNSSSNQDESNMDIGETLKDDSRIVCVPSFRAGSDSNEELLSSIYTNAQPSTSKSTAENFSATKKNLEGKGNDKRMPVNGDQLHVEDDESLLEIDNDSESVISLESESDIVELEVEESLSEDVGMEDDHCSRTRGFVRDTAISAAKSDNDMQEDEGIKEDTNGCSSNATLDQNESSSEVTSACDDISKCSKTFDNGLELKKHTKQNFCVRHICSSCNKILDTEREFKKHLTVCSSYKANACQLCKKMFKNKVSLYSHTATHFKKKPPYYCKKCKTKFGRKKELEVHIKKCKPNDEKKKVVIYYKCGVCQNGYTNYSSFRKHFAKHLNKSKDAICGICSVICKGAVELKGHVWACHGTHECDFCTKKFMDIWYLKRHLTTHST